MEKDLGHGIFRPETFRRANRDKGHGAWGGEQGKVPRINKFSNL